ncbi:carbamoyl-phosphate synthase (glutamine-hydrolyzing) large subunit [Paludifilum halophilum]|uniref:Carbamoyl phosphate synthase large chain n=1 Tax=Paludifilum halophilum TaxID=1642702 RepID=A0A235B895_9BACL|nr:carbamoyl-phosphate synthase (glutamine-hydrolyzing) large subunit [Paludifilum halophilum]OYD08077.1 carbamoyl phosphate synthase large subunit [Paludifilum halophilum]
MDESKAFALVPEEIQSVLVIGSGPIVVGQAAEFDYAGTQACLALQEEGLRVILANNNPATIMTDSEAADVLYMEPLNVDVLTRIIRQERPDGLLATMGGQTGLNLAVELQERGVLESFGVRLLGTPIDTIRRGEDREAFKRMMEAIGEPVPRGDTVSSVDEALRWAASAGYPVVVRPAYTLGGFGGGVAEDETELKRIARQGLAASPIGQILVEQSILGWKEIEYEMMRDEVDTCIAVCNMENIDPVGVHTGDSIVTAPSQTLTDRQYQRLRSVACQVIRTLKVVGGCNIQFALHPETGEYKIIEVNPRVSRSSALASKATGYPIARLAAKLALGYRLDECLNPVTGHTFASFEPALDYVVVKIPRWPFDKFPEGDRRLGTRMKATGEVMALGRNLETALYKALRSLDMDRFTLLSPECREWTVDELKGYLRRPDDQRLFALGEAFRRGWTVEEVNGLTGISPYFLYQLHGMVRLEQSLAEYRWETVPRSLLRQAKERGMADAALARIYGIPETKVRSRWADLGWKPSYKWVDTCAGEFVAETPYYYSSWQGADEVDAATGEFPVLVLGSGPIRIGQGIEFDYCSVHAAKALRKGGASSVVVNNNPETVSTDYATADRLYFEPLTAEDVLHVAEKEKVKGALVQYGGQTAVGLTRALEEGGLAVLGTSADSIDRVEDRDRFYAMLKQLEIPHIPGETVATGEAGLQAAERLGYPILVRPSYVIGGQGMQVVREEEELVRVLHSFLDRKGDPLLLDRFVEGLEVEVDAVTDGKDVVIPTLIQHIERAGIHSGDSCSILGAPDLTEEQRQKVLEYTERIARFLSHAGLLNIQFVLDGGQVYVLEVNPRASRTIPVVSKVVGVPMVEWATRVQLGEALASFAPAGLMPPVEKWAVKAPVFSSLKLPGVEPALGPEMRSTGEVLGLGDTPEEAAAKVLPWAVGGELPRLEKGTSLLLSVADPHKRELIEILPALVENGVRLAATPGTAQAIRETGAAPVETVSPSRWDEWFRENSSKAVLNLPARGGNPETDGFQLRQKTLEWQVPCFTSLDTFQWWIRAAACREPDSWTVAPLKTTVIKEAMTR